MPVADGVTTVASVSGASTSRAQAIVNAAERWLTSPVTPYCWDGGGDNGPTHGDGQVKSEYSGPSHESGCYANTIKGFDCSGLVKYAIYQALGISLGHTVADEAQGVTDKGPNVTPKIVRIADLQPGDIVVFGSSASDLPHDGIYIGNNYIVNAYDYKNDGDNGPNNEYWGVAKMPLPWISAGWKFSEGIRYWASGSIGVHAPTADPTGYVADSFGSTVTPIDTATNKAGTAIQVGEDPEGIAVSPDGATAYVANSGSNTVTPVSTATNKAGKAIPAGDDPFGVAITPDGKTLYVADFADDAVIPIDIATETQGTPIAVGSSPSGIAITPNGKTAYVANFGDGTVTPIALASGTPQTPIHVGSGPDDIAITPNGATVYVSNSVSGTVTPISTATNTAGKAITVGADPQGIAITPNGATAYVAENAGLMPVSTVTNTAGKAISTGASETPVDIAITSSGATAYVANMPTEGGTAQGTQNVTPISLPTGKVGTAIAVKTGGGIALS